MDADVAVPVDGDQLRRSKRNKFRLDIVGMQFQLPHGPNKPRGRSKSAVTPRKSAKCDLKETSVNKSPRTLHGQITSNDVPPTTPSTKVNVRTVVDKSVASSSSSAVRPTLTDSPTLIATKQRKSMPTEKRAPTAKKSRSESVEQPTVAADTPGDVSVALPVIEPQWLDTNTNKTEPPASPVETACKAMDDDSSTSNGLSADGDFACTRCPAKYDSRTGLANHLKLHGVDKRYPCNRCDFSCDNPKTMRSHRRLHGTDGVAPLAKLPKLISKELVMKKLKKRREQQPTKRPPSATANDYPPALSPMSPLTLSEDVRAATGTTEKKKETPLTSPRPHSRRRELLHCAECPFQTKNPKRLAAHETGHQRVSGFKCPVCSFRSTSAGFLKRHAEGHGLASIPWPPVYEGEPRASANAAVKSANHKKKVASSPNVSKPKPDDLPPVLKPSAPPISLLNKTLVRNSKGQFAPKDPSEMDNEAAEPPVLEFNEDAEVNDKLPRCRVCLFVTAHRPELTSHYRRAHPAAHIRANTRKGWRWCRTCGIWIRRYSGWTLHRLVLHPRLAKKWLIRQMLAERRRLLPAEAQTEHSSKPAESATSTQSSPNANGNPRVQFCPECPFRTANKMEMTRHQENHTIRLSHACEKCSFSCKNMLSLVHHRLMHERAEQRLKPDGDQSIKSPPPTTDEQLADARLLKCDQCPYQAKFNWDIKAHCKMHDGNRKYRCDVCSYNSHRPNALTEHKKLHDTSSKPDESDQQKTAVNSNSTLVRPTKKKRKRRPKKETKVRNKKGVVVGERIDDLRRRVYVCRFCPFKANLCAHLAQHARLHFGKRTHSCTRCSLSTNLLARLEQHVQLHPPVTLSAGRNRRKGGYQCRHCPFTAQSYPRLWHHMQKHKRRGKIACDQCTFSTGSPLCMAKHRAVHQTTVVAGKRPKGANLPGSMSPAAKRPKLTEAAPVLACSKPNGVIAHAPPILRNFSSDDSMKQQCDECPYASDNPLLLKLHIKLHFGRQRSFKCNVCSFSANMPESLYHHLSLHGPVLSDIDDDFPKTQSRTLHAIARKRHNSLSNDAALVKAGAVVVTCSQCQFRTAHAERMEQHRLQHVQHAQQRLLATIKRSALSDDAYGSPKIRRAERRTDRQLHCTKCSFRCDTAIALRRHVHLHGSDAPFACSVCDYRAAHINIVRFHEQNHHVDVPVSLLYKQAVRCKRLTPTAPQDQGISGDSIDENCVEPPTLRCSMCAFETAKVGDLSEHWQTHKMDAVADKTGFLLKLNLVARSRRT